MQAPHAYIKNLCHRPSYLLDPVCFTEQPVYGLFIISSLLKTPLGNNDCGARRSALVSKNSSNLMVNLNSFLLRALVTL